MTPDVDVPWPARADSRGRPDLLHLVRHGRTEANAGGRLLGRADPPLDDVGRGQADAIARVLGEVDRVVSSPLRRAVDTAAALGVEPEIDERWIELDYGELDGAELARVPPDLWDRWQRDPAFRPPGGESLATVGRRVREACDDLVQAATGQDVVVVSHVSPIKAAVAWALSVGDQISWRLFLAPGSITRIGVGPRGAVVRSFNDVAHLTEGPG